MTGLLVAFIVALTSRSFTARSSLVCHPDEQTTALHFPPNANRSISQQQRRSALWAGRLLRCFSNTWRSFVSTAAFGSISRAIWGLTTRGRWHHQMRTDAWTESSWTMVFWGAAEWHLTTPKLSSSPTDLTNDVTVFMSWFTAESELKQLSFHQ